MTKLHSLKIKCSRLLAALAAVGMLLCPAGSARAEGESVPLPEDLSAQTAFTFSAKGFEGAEARLLDGQPLTRVQLPAHETISMALPAGAAWVRLDWYEAPAAATLSQLSAAGEPLFSESVADGLLTRYVELLPGASSLLLTAERALSLSDVFVYGPGDAPAAYGSMEALPEKCDLLLVCAHTGDEQLRFTGLAPLYALEEGLRVCVVFLSHENRLAQQQAMDGLRLCGVSAQPVFCGFPYKFMADIVRADYHWKRDAVIQNLVTVIRRCKPEVIVTHDPAGEAGDMMHAYTAENLLSAVDAAANSAARGQEESEKRYGAWQVQKVYFHAEAGDGVTPAVDAPLWACPGESAASLSARAYGLYSGLVMYNNAVHPGQAQSYTLAYSAVGEDGETDDLFAHLSEARLTNPARVSEAASALEAAAAVTPSPSPTPTASPTPLLTASPAPGIAPLTPPARRFPFARVLLPLGAGAVAVSLLLLLWRQRKKDGSFSKVLLLFCFLVAVAALIVSLVFLIGWRKAETASAPETPPHTGDPLPTHTPAPTPLPADDASMEASALSPAPSPSATPDPWAAYFRQEGEAAEVVRSDAEKGQYEYRSDTLSVLIDTRTGVEGETRKYTYYVAHIRMRADALRTGFGSFREDGKDKTFGVTIARRYRAVLAITGDDMIEREEDLKGFIIRSGRVYNKHKGESILAVYPDMSLRAYSRNNVTLEQLLQDGVENTYSFGPTLVENGEIYKGVSHHRVSSPNPRVALGMVEPGHYVAIVVDGRLPGYSMGISTRALAQLFLDEGCTVAHNMDGGASSALLFMGEYVNKRSEDHTRIVPDLILFGYSELVPAPDEPLENDGVVLNK